MASSHRRFPFTVDQLRRRIGAAALRRGEELAASENVLDWSVSEDEDFVRLTGSVQGTRDEPYVVELRAPRQGGLNAVTSTCTCPQGLWCKHVAALAVVASQDDGEPDALDAGARRGWELWIDRLASAVAEPGRDATPRAVRWLISVDADLARLRLRPQVHPEGNGWHELDVAQPLPAEIADADRLDLLALRDFRRVQARQRSWSVPEGRIGERLVERLLDAGRLQRGVGSEARVMARGPQRTLALRWRMDESGAQVLEREPDWPGEIFLLAHAWYLDTEAGLMGRLAGPWPEALVESLGRLPPLPSSLAHEVGARLRALPGLGELPMPGELAAEAVVDFAPTPLLDLDLLDVPAYLKLRGRRAAFRLRFDYGGRLIERHEPDAVVTRREGERLVRLARDRDAEQRAVLQLRRAGLSPDTGTGFAPGAAAERADRWVLDAWQDLDQVPAFVELASRLAREGFRVRTAERFPVELAAPGGELELAVAEESGEPWFELDLGIDVDGQRVSLLPILLAALKSRALRLEPAAREPEDAVWLAPIDARRRLPLPLKRLRTLLGPLLELGGDTLAPGAQRLRLPRVRAAALATLEETGTALRGADALRRYAAALREPAPIEEPVLPAAFHAELRPYQSVGLRWLQGLRRHGLGGILADDMGLGKTVQLIAHLAVERAAGRLERPALVVTATSVLPNWRRELARFAPGLPVLVLHGAQREAAYASVSAHAVVLTTYGLLARDRKALAAQPWSVLVLDEAQAIKNSRARARAAAIALEAEQRLALTGTPLENHLGELWSLLDAVVPGLLGDERTFTRLVRTPIEKHGEEAVRVRLARRIAPFLLRRTKEQVAPELPPKTEIVETVELEGAQRDLYESLRLAQEQRVREAIASRGLAQSGIVVLDALLKLRQACCDPRLVPLDAARGVAGSAKLERLLPMLDELLAEGRRVLLFSQFTSLLDLLEPELVARGIAFVRLDGATLDRDTPVARFQAGEVPVFLISLRAGGVGLNLTAADTVIHYDPWWNPAVENQATDRAYRIGQDKPVFVFKLVCAGTVEERIQALQQRKAALAEALLGEGGGGRLELTPDEVDALFAPLA